MQDLMGIAVEAIRCRREKSPFFCEFIRELEGAGLTSSEITRLLETAEANMLPEEASTPSAA